MAKPGLFRVLAAVGYDSLLVLALLFFATAVLLPLNDNKAFSHQQIYYPCYLIVVCFCFYSWFWTHGGQTLGLRAWKMKVLSEQHEPITWKQALIRFLFSLVSFACFGLGFFWILVDKNRRSWHDIVSKTGLYLITKT